MIQSLARRDLWRLAAMGWLAVIAWCTLRSEPGALEDIARLSWTCIVCGDGGVADVILNLLLFAPLGLALNALGWRLSRTILVVAAMSTSIELIQGHFLVGRDASISDVLSNTTGATLGWLGYVALGTLARPTVRFARRGAATLLAAMAGLWLATGAGLQPSLTETMPWFGQPSRPGRGPVPFPGTFQGATIDGIAIPNEAMAQHAPWRDSIAVELRATRSSSATYARGIVMLRIVDTAHTVLVAMDQKGDDAWLRLRLRAADWKLHYPRWQVSHGMRMTPGVPWRFRWQWLPDRFTIINEPAAGPPNPVVLVPLSIGLGWTFIHPFVNTVSTTRLVWTALWLGFWFGLLGWLAGRLGARASTVIGVVAVSLFVAASGYWKFQLQVGEVAAAVLAYAGFAAAALIRRPERTPVAALR